MHLKIPDNWIGREVKLRVLRAGIAIGKKTSFADADLEIERMIASGAIVHTGYEDIYAIKGKDADTKGKNKDDKPKT